MAKEDKDKKTKKPTALKRLEQSEKRRLLNKAFTSQVRTVIRQYEGALKAGTNEDRQSHLQKVYSVMDKGVKRGIYQARKASRTKSRMTARLNKA